MRQLCRISLPAAGRAVPSSPDRLGGNGKRAAKYPGGFTDTEGRPLTGTSSYPVE